MYNFGLKHKYQVLIPYYWISQSNVPRLRGSIIIYENFYLSVSQGFYYRLQMCMGGNKYCTMGRSSGWDYQSTHWNSQPYLFIIWNFVFSKASKEVTHKSKVFTDYGHSYISLVEMKILESRWNVWLSDSGWISVSILSSTT